MKRSGAFTLIELLVTIAVVGMLIGLMVPVLGVARCGARQAVCGSNLHQLGLGANLYLDDYDGRYWPYFSNVTGGRLWWFGFEPGGPNAGTNRPLDKTQSVLAPYLSTLDDRFQCPAFPYDDPAFFPKFDRRSASYGYNVDLVGDKQSQYVGRETGVFVFADGVHFDQPNSFNEGHYVTYTPNTSVMSGYAHFRHMGIAQAVMMDGHVQKQFLGGASHAVAGGSDAGNLAAPDGSSAIYGN